MTDSRIRIKTHKQVEGIRKSCKLAAQTLEYLKEFVKEGVSTLELNDKADEFIRKNGAYPAPLNYRGFPKSICTSINNVICHGVPSEKVILQDGDIVNIDVTTILEGYFGDTSTMYLIGNVSQKAQDLVTHAKECLYAGIKQVRPGFQFGEINFEITKLALSKGYSVVKDYCGHGTGVEFHEPPNLCHYAEYVSGPRMGKNMIFTIEPMLNEGQSDTLLLEDQWTVVTKFGGLSAQFEHTVLVTENGYEILTEL